MTDNPWTPTVRIRWEKSKEGTFLQQMWVRRSFSPDLEYHLDEEWRDVPTEVVDDAK